MELIRLVLGKESLVDLSFSFLAQVSDFLGMLMKVLRGNFCFFEEKESRKGVEGSYGK